jgi:hypothetical protein
MRNRKSQKGQVSVEFILFAVIITFATTYVAKTIRSQQYVAQLVSGPWDMLAGMIESGVWKPQKEAKALHPGHINRHASLKGQPDE